MKPKHYRASTLAIGSFASPDICVIYTFWIITGIGAAICAAIGAGATIACLAGGSGWHMKKMLKAHPSEHPVAAPIHTGSIWLHPPPTSPARTPQKEHAIGRGIS